MGVLSSILRGGVGTKVAIYSMIAVLVAGGAYIGAKEVQVYQLNKKVEILEKEKNKLVVDNKILEENNEVFRENMKKLATANFTNWTTAKALIDERAKAADTIANLAAANRRTKESLDRISKTIEDVLKDPNNDGPIAPVLREVIREIQKERAKL